MIGGRKLAAIKHKLASTSGSMNTGISPPSMPFASPAIIPATAPSTTKCHSQKLKCESEPFQTDFPVIRGTIQCNEPKKALVKNP